MTNTKPVLAMDFDGVAAQYSGWKGEDHLGRPMPGLEYFLQKVIAQGWVVILYSCRPAWRLERWAQLNGLSQYFSGYNGNPYFAEHEQEKSCKPVATVYLDDRAIRFHGDWNEVFTILQSEQSEDRKRIYELEMERDDWMRRYKQAEMQLKEMSRDRRRSKPSED